MAIRHRGGPETPGLWAKPLLPEPLKREGIGAQLESMHCVHGGAAMTDSELPITGGMQAFTTRKAAKGTRVAQRNRERLPVRGLGSTGT